MKNPCVGLFLLISFFLLFVSDSFSEEKFLISKEEAIEIAKKKFTEVKKRSLDNYSLTITDKFDNTEVFFQGKGEFARPGYHLTIIVDKKTGEVSVMHGQ